MTEAIARNVIHATFAIERRYAASPARVFGAFSDPKAKAHWFGSGEQRSPGTPHEFDFRVGGRERFSAGSSGGPLYSFDAQYRDIVPDQRIVYSYDMLADARRISVSLVTVEFLPDGSGTRLLFTEQGVFLDGHDTPAQRHHGTALALAQLDVEVGAALGAASTLSPATPHAIET
jgi:uncharacterized protein YndB with AHSA1/START domain